MQGSIAAADEADIDDVTPPWLDNTQSPHALLRASPAPVTPRTSSPLRGPRASRSAAAGRRLAASVCLALCLALPAAAQPDFHCASVQPSASKSPPYRRIAGEARCEGYFEQTVSQPFVELVSLTREVPGVAPAGGATALRIRGTAPVASQLVIQPLRPSPFYRVDAPLDAGSALQWDAQPMLRATGLRMADLGFVARAAIPGADMPAAVPVALGTGDADPRTAYAVVRASVAVSAVAARRYRMEGGDAATAAWRELPGPPLYAWDPLVLPIELPADGRDVRIDVRALGADGRPLPILRFIVAGAAR